MPVIYRTRRNFVGEVLHGTPPDRTVIVPNGNQGFRQGPLPAKTKEGETRLDSRSVAQSPVKAEFYDRGINPWNENNHPHDGVLDSRSPRVLYEIEKET